MIKIEKNENCCGCSACVNACTKNAIKFVEDDEGFKYPSINKDKCINCDICTKVCPIQRESHSVQYNYPRAYAGISLNSEIRKESSSGGIFTILAEEILKSGGVVFGAKFDSEFNVVHNYVETEKELKHLRGSKYVQSEIGNSYVETKKFLEDGRMVLFTGTPCQISGLKSFLKKDFDNLYTQDIICFGVPSPKVWRKYLEYRKQKDNNMPKNITFRDKRNSWKLFSVMFDYGNRQYEQSKAKDLYMKFFLEGLSLRTSCYNCKFKLKNKVADITLGDFWGIENIMPELDDDKGVSAIIVNNEKGKKLLETVSARMNIKEVGLNNIIASNSMLEKSTQYNKSRENFFSDLDKMDFEKLAKKYLKKPSFMRKVASKIKRKLLK